LAEGSGKGAAKFGEGTDEGVTGAGEAVGRE